MADKPKGTIDDFIGLLAGKSKGTMTIEVMNEIIADGWAKGGRAGLPQPDPARLEEIRKDLEARLAAGKLFDFKE
jgi:hypothetical protein